MKEGEANTLAIGTCARVSLSIGFTLKILRRGRCGGSGGAFIASPSHFDHEKLGSRPRLTYARPWMWRMLASACQLRSEVCPRCVNLRTNHSVPALIFADTILNNISS